MNSSANANSNVLSVNPNVSTTTVLTTEDALLISFAVVSVWAVAWGFRVLGKLL